MIRHTEHARTTRLADARGCLAAFGSVFVLSGLTALWLGLTEPGPDDLARLVAVLIGAAHLAGGLWIGFGASRDAEADADGVTIRSREWLTRTTRRLDEREIGAVEVVESRDSEGDPMFAPALRLVTGERVPLTTQTLPARETVTEMAAAVARRIGRPEAVAW